MTIEEIKYREFDIQTWWCAKLSVMWNIYYETVIAGHMYDYADLFIDYDSIKYCVEHKVAFEKFSEWYEGTLYDNKKQNLDNFVRYGWI